MSPVSGAERIVHIDVRHGSQLLGESGIVLLLFLVEADVLEKHDLAGLQSRGFGLGVLADDVGSHDDIHAQQLRQPHGHRSQGVFHVELALGTAQVRAGNDGSAIVQQVFQGLDGFPDALVVGDFAVGQRNVEVAAYQDLFALYVDVLNGFFVVGSHVRHPFNCSDLLKIKQFLPYFIAS